MLWLVFFFSWVEQEFLLQKLVANDKFFEILARNILRWQNSEILQKVTHDKDENGKTTNKRHQVQ